MIVNYCFKLLIWQSQFVALTWNLEELMPPSERYIFNFNSKEELEKWHLYSDSEYGGMNAFYLIVCRHIPV